MKVVLTPLNAPNRNGRIYTEANFENIPTETCVMFSMGCPHPLDLAKMIASITEVRVIKLKQGDFLIGELTPVYNAALGGKEMIDVLLAQVPKGDHIYLDLAGTVSWTEGKEDMSTYKFSHWLLTSDL